MTRRLGFFARSAAAAAVFFLGTAALQAQQSFTAVCEQVNKKMVKLFGSGGFKGLPAYGTGIVVSPDGYILTVNNHMLNTPDLRVHLYDGRVFQAIVLAKEPELDIALVKIDSKDVTGLPYFDMEKAVMAPAAEPGDWVLAFSNQFSIATRDEPMTVQRGVIAANSKLLGRKGVFDAPYFGEAYFLDMIACNPGSAGGALTTRKGELIGIIGRELKNRLSDTWINYAVPIRAKVQIERIDGKNEAVDIAVFTKEAMGPGWKVKPKVAKKTGPGGYTGLVLVPDVVDRTPPYVEEVVAGSPAAQAGLKADDLVVYFDGELVQSIRIYRDLLKMTGPGTEVTLEIQRDNRLMTVKMKLGEHPK